MEEPVVPVPIPTQWDGTILGLLAIVLMVLLGAVILYLRHQLMVAGPAKDARHAAEMKECREREDKTRADFLAALEAMRDNNEAMVQTLKDKHEMTVQALKDKHEADMKALADNCTAERKVHREELAQLRHELTTHRHEILDQIKDAKPSKRS